MKLSIESATHLPGGNQNNPKWDAWYLAVPDGDTPKRTDERRMNVTFYRGIGHRLASRTNRPPGGARAGAVKIRRATWTPRDLGHDRTKWPHIDPGWMYASPPTIGEVLECLCSDAIMLDDAPDWAGWADELGFFSADSITVEDVRRSQATHAACIEQTSDLRRLLGDLYRSAVYDGPEDGWSSVDGDTLPLVLHVPAPGPAPCPRLCRRRGRDVGGGGRHHHRHVRQGRLGLLLRLVPLRAADRGVRAPRDTARGVTRRLL